MVPGSGSTGMEAVARQFATGRKVLVIRNGWFSYRWSQIFEMGAIPAETTVLKARPTGPGPQAPFAPAPIDEVVATIGSTRPDLVFAPHVETSAGMMLPDDYLRAVADAVHEHGGLFVLDCVASGAMWVDMAATGVDVLVSAPQKGWSSTPCAGLVMLGERARAAIEHTTSSSFSREVSPLARVTARRGTPSALATNAISASLALPSTGGAAMRILSAAPCSPATALFFAPGCACTAISQP